MLTERMQLAAIYQLVYGDDGVPDVNPESFQDLWRSVYLMTERQMDGMEPYQALYNALIGVHRGDGDKWQWASEQAARIKAAGEPMVYQSYADLRGKLPPITWLWRPWIPRGMMTLAAGFPGAGKTWLALDIARAVLHGQVWPDGTPIERPGRVIYVEGEAVPQISVNRLEKMGLDGRNMFPMLPEGGEILNLTNMTYQHRLIDMVMGLRPELIVVDSLSDVDDGGQNSKEEVQALLRFLVDLARMGNCGLLVLHHLKKPANGQQFQLVTMHDLRGSGYIAAQGRVVWGYSVVSSSGFDLKDGKRHLQIMKTNMDEWADPLGVDLVDLPDGGKKLVYGAAPSLDASTARDDCSSWLIGFLKENGSSKAKVVVSAALDAGYSRDMLYRARKELEGRVVNTRGHKHPGNAWVLSEDAGGSAEDSEESEESGAFCQPVG